MNVLFTDIMTVYNYRRDRETGEESWQRSVVRGVQWSHNKAELTAPDNVQTAARVEKITVDFQRGYGNKPYLPPREYAGLTAEEAAHFWTLSAGTGMDMIVLGETDRQIGKDYRLKDLREEFEYAVTVAAVSDNRNRPGLKSIKIIGKQ